MPRLYEDYKGIDYFRMQVEYIDYYDLSPTPPFFEHIDLATKEIKDGFVGDR